MSRDDRARRPWDQKPAKTVAGAGLNAIPEVIQIDLPEDVALGWGSRLDEIIATVPAGCQSTWMGADANTIRGCPGNAVALKTSGKVCGADAAVDLGFRNGYLCAAQCRICNTSMMMPREYCAMVERIRRSLGLAVGMPTVMTHPRREAEVTYRWWGIAQHVQMLTDQSHRQQIVVIANDPWVCPWCQPH